MEQNHEVSSDPYEQKLFQMFQSCDAENSGLLNEKSLRRLCEMLELRDNGSVLINDLAARGNIKSRVSFLVFKEALLNFLGTELDGSTTSGKMKQKTSAKAKAMEQVLIISDGVESYQYIDSPPESSEREVSPKLIVGSKKYGRRSRPHLLQDDTTPSDSETDVIINTNNRNNSDNNIVQRSASQTDIAAVRRHRSLAGGNKLKRCASLPAQKDQRYNERNLRKIKPSVTTAASVTTSVATTTTDIQDTSLLSKLKNTNVDSVDIPTQIEKLPANNVIAIWERAGISNAKGLLITLGFDEEEINLVQLSKVLEEELRIISVGEPQTILLRASLALQSAELTSLRQTFRQLYDQNKKLHADNKDANNRVALLAQEVDERHASIEDTTRKEIRLLEQRHAEVVRDLTLRLANDRENWINLTSSLEAKLKSFEQNELKLKTDYELLSNENSALEEEHKSLQKQITELLQTNIKLNREITEFEEDHSRTSEDGKKHGFITHDKTNTDVDDDEEEILRLVEKINTLQMENTNLRDKNDELVSEMEAINVELCRIRSKNKKLTVESSKLPNEKDVRYTVSLTKESKNQNDSNLPEELNTIKETINLKEQEHVDSGGEGSPEIEGIPNISKDLEIDDEDKRIDEITKLKKRVQELEEELKKVQAAQAVSEERCRELDSSLEQMQRAYEDCEDYWQNKLSEERQLFEKERQIYEDEQQESDKKFTELMEKVREYEEQYSKDGRLTPIEEKGTLEEQYAELEAEAEEVRKNAKMIFEEKSKEIELLQREIEDLRLRLGESEEILTGANEFNNDVRNKGHGIQSPANSPINYLWHQSTIQSPIKQQPQHQQQYQAEELNSISSISASTPRNCTNLSTSETTIFSTSPIKNGVHPSPSPTNSIANKSPIQKPAITKPTIGSDADADGEAGDGDSCSSFSGKSFESNSVASTHSVHHSHNNHNNNNNNNSCNIIDHNDKNTTSKTTTASKILIRSTCSSPSSSPGGIKEELKRLKFYEISLREQIKDLSLQRDGLVMELQQLQEARPVLEKAYARTAHPTLMQRVNQLELKNRHLQNVIKQQQQYTESLMQQTWQQHHAELAEMRNRIEAQGMMMAEQSQRLQNADILVKELYVENAHLAATVQRMEQHRSRNNLLHQHQGLSGLPGMP